MGQVGRRRFLTALGATALAIPLDCGAQRGRTVPLVGVIVDGNRRRPSGELYWEPLINTSLDKAGYTVGTDIDLQWRFTEGKFERITEFANEFARLEVDVILCTQSFPAVGFIKAATSKIPIVMHGYPPNPVSTGLIASFARPGGNVTGTTWVRDITELTVKQFQLLREAAPNASRVAILRWAESPPASWIAQIGARVNEAFGFEVADFPVANPAELRDVLDRVSAHGSDALFVFYVSFIIQRGSEIATFAIKQKLITSSSGVGFTYDGGLLYYGPDGLALIDRTISYVDRILRGANPGELPVEEPTKFQFAFNAKTAKAIGYALPPSLRLRVDTVIE